MSRSPEKSSSAPSTTGDELDQLASEAEKIGAAPTAAPAAPNVDEPRAAPQRENPFMPTPEEAAAKMMEARMLSGGLLRGLELFIKQRTGVVVQVVEPKILEQGAERVAYVLAKYDAGLPAWLKPYEVELRAGMFFGGVIFSVFIAVDAELERRAKAPPAAPSA